MKRESVCSPIHHFSFGARFDETLMKCYSVIYQYIRLFNHQFIGFSPLNKSAGKATEVNTAIRRLVGRTSILPTDKEKPLIRAFSSRTADANAKNAPMSQRGCTPLDTPACPMRL